MARYQPSRQDEQDMRHAYSGYAGSGMGGRRVGRHHRMEERQATQGYGDSSFYGSPYESGYERSEQRGDYWHEDNDAAGRHRGVGPKGYKRSDARIHEDVCDCLTEDAWLDASGIEVGVRDGEVSLSGTIPSRQDKRRAEDLADRVSGVRDIRNNLRVRDSTPRA